MAQTYDEWIFDHPENNEPSTAEREGECVCRPQECDCEENDALERGDYEYEQWKDKFNETHV